MLSLPLQFVGVQVDVTSKTEGTAIGDKAGVPLLVKYDARLREKGKDNVAEITDTVQVCTTRSSVQQLMRIISICVSTLAGGWCNTSPHRALESAQSAGQ
jgi:hypothetical protein